MYVCELNNKSDKKNKTKVTNVTKSREVPHKWELIMDLGRWNKIFINFKVFNGILFILNYLINTSISYWSYYINCWRNKHTNFHIVGKQKKFTRIEAIT